MWGCKQNFLCNLNPNCKINQSYKKSILISRGIANYINLIVNVVCNG